MARLLELQGPTGISAGREVIAVSATRVVKGGYKGTYTETVALGGKSASTRYRVDVLRVEEPVRAGYCAGSFDSVHTLLASSEPGREPGQKVTIDGKFKQFVGGPDDPTAQGLKRDGVEIDVKRDPDGNVLGVEVVYREVYTWKGEKHLPHDFGIKK